MRLENVRTISEALRQLVVTGYHSSCSRHVLLLLDHT